MRTVGEWLGGQPDLPRLDRELLVCRAAGISRSQVLGRPERVLDARALTLLDDWAARRRAGEPLAYITGEREFWGLAFEVSPRVLVPRPETELLVEAALALADHEAAPAAARRWLELGTGSGAVAIALALEARARHWQIELTATDVCADALAVAARNGVRHGVTVFWRQADWLDGLAGDGHAGGRFELIVSNPPYVAEDDPHLAALGFEPRRALTAGASGLDDLQHIARRVPEHLQPGGWVVLEHGADQGAAVRTMLRDAGLDDIATIRDLAGHERVTRARRPCGNPFGREHAA